MNTIDLHNNVMRRRRRLQRQRRFIAMGLLTLGWLALLYIASPAKSQVLITDANGIGAVSKSCYGGSCTTIFSGTWTSDPHVIHVPQRDYDERAWLAYCQPKFKMDNYGVQYYVYAKPGCEFGRTED